MKAKTSIVKSKIQPTRVDSLDTAITDALLSKVLRTSGAALALFDEQGHLVYHSDNLINIIGYHFDEIGDNLFFKVLGHESIPEIFKSTKLAPDSSTTHSLLPYTHKDGSSRIISIRSECIEITDHSYLILSVTDMTKEVERQNRLLQQSQMKDVVLDINQKLSEETPNEVFFEYLLSRVGDIMPYADSGCILLLSEDDNETLIPAASFGYLEDEIRQFRIRIKDSFFYSVCSGVFEKTFIINDIHSLADDGFPENPGNKDHQRVRSCVSGPIIKGGLVYGFISIDSYSNNVYTEDDVQIMEYMRQQLGIALSRWDMIQKNAYLSKYDQLTGLLNRWYLNQLSDDEFEHWKQQGASVTCAAMDLNDLKLVNDRLGHHQGDTYITSLSTALKLAFRSTDYLFRLGGDEFAGIFFDLSEEKLTEKLEEINASLAENEILLSVADLTPGFGFGIASLEGSSRDIHEVLKIADKRMYTHKALMKAHKNAR